MQQTTKTRAYLTVQPSTVNVTYLWTQEWRDALFLWYGLEPPELPTQQVLNQSRPCL